MSELKYNHTNSRSDFASITPRDFVNKYIKYLPWIIFSMMIFLTLAFLKLRYSTNVYSVSGTILVKDPNPISSNSDKMGEMMFMQPNRNLNDEIQLIRSTGMAKRVVRSLGMEVIYLNVGSIRTTLLHPRETPFILEILRKQDSTSGFSLPVLIRNTRQFSFQENGQILEFGQSFEHRGGVFKLNRTEVPLENFSSMKFIVDWQSTESRGRAILGGLKVMQSADAPDILALTYETENINNGIDIINEWMKEYQLSGLEEKRRTAVNALTFIDQQLDTARRELTGVESNLQGFRERNKLFNIERQSDLFVSKISDLDKQIAEEEVKLKIIDNLISYISDERNPFRIVPSSLGIEEPSLIQLITEYNKAQVGRETALKTTTSINPMVIEYETAIAKLKSDILQNLRNVRQAYETTVSDLNRQNAKAFGEITLMPGKEKQILDITRRQKILEALFSYLLQKKLETSIGSASTISSVRVVEPASSNGVPVAPNRKGLYMIALFAGLAVPGVILFLMEYLNDKINSRADIQRNTDAPILGEIGHSEENKILVVNKNNRKFIAEQFRILRTNLQYVLQDKKHPVIMVTSSFSGEGKSFVSLNMAAVMGLTGKKTVVMEFDIRKPKIASNLNIKRNVGITNYLIGMAEIKDLLLPVPESENLWLIPCGPIPPNPAELLLNHDRLLVLFEYLKKEFDYIMVDTAPVGLVSDAFVLNQYTDAALYLVRHNYTNKKQVQMINEIFEQKKLVNLSLIINDIKQNGSYGNYFGMGGYGYGYAKSDYFENESTSRNNRFKSFMVGIKKRFIK